MNTYNDKNNNSVTILSQLDQTGLWRGGGQGACFHGESCSVFVSQWDFDVQGVWLFNLQD